MIGSTQDIDNSCGHQKMEFEVNDLGKTKFCVGLQIDHLPSRMLVHQSIYVQKILEKSIWINHIQLKPHGCSVLVLEKDAFQPREEEKEILGPEYPYPSIIATLMYLANSTGPDIAFAVNLLARHSAAPTKSHWIRGKQVLRYLNVKKDLRLFFGKTQDHGHSSFFFIEEQPFHANRLSKQLWQNPQIILRLSHYMMNHVCKMINHIEQSCGISSIKAPTIIYEDNTAFVRLYQEQYD